MRSYQGIRIFAFCMYISMTFCTTAILEPIVRKAHVLMNKGLAPMCRTVLAGKILWKRAIDTCYSSSGIRICINARDIPGAVPLICTI